jgi:hypothetical protein
VTDVFTLAQSLVTDHQSSEPKRNTVLVFELGLKSASVTFLTPGPQKYEIKAFVPLQDVQLDVFNQEITEVINKILAARSQELFPGQEQDIVLSALHQLQTSDQIRFFVTTLSVARRDDKTWLPSWATLYGPPSFAGETHPFMSRQDVSEALDSFYSNITRAIKEAADRNSIDISLIDNVYVRSDVPLPSFETVLNQSGLPQTVKIHISAENVSAIAALEKLPTLFAVVAIN